MRQVEFVKYNKLRRDEFQIRTRIFAEDGRRMVEKTPVRPEGKAHIESFLAHYQPLCACFLRVEPLKPEPTPEGICYPFLSGETLEEKLAPLVKDKEALPKALLETLEDMFAVRENGLVPFASTEEFKEVFGTDYPYEDTSFSISNIDMLFENVMDTGRGLALIDYEWVFDFPVPVSFIRYRNLYYFYKRFYGELHETWKLYEFLALFGIEKERADLFEDMEAHFQDYVHGKVVEGAHSYSYTARYVKESIPFGPDSNGDIGRDKAMELKDNHIRNLEMLIADQQAIIQKYQKVKKIAKSLGLLGVYKKVAGDKKKILRRLKFPEEKSPLVSIIIPAYNQAAYTMNCLESILLYTKGITYEVIVADDGSTDETVKLPKYVSHVRVVRSGGNLGFLRNCNNAAGYAKGKYLFFLNNDTRVTEGWLPPLVKLLESDPSIGMTGAKLVYPDGRLQEAGAIIWRDGSGCNYGRMEDPARPEFNYVRDVDYISGAAILISRKLWDQLGGFDESLAPAYYEDTDLAFAVREAGLRVVYQPQSVIVHYEGISNGTDDHEGMKRYQKINREKFKKKWAHRLQEQYPYVEGLPNLFPARERLLGKKVVLMIDFRVPEFDSDAGSVSTFSYIRLLIKKGFVVKFLANDFCVKEPYTSTLAQMGVEVISGEFYRHHAKEWILKNQRYLDIAFINRPHLAFEYLDWLKENTDIKVLFYGHDLHFLREDREYQVTKDPAHKKESEEIKPKELAVIEKADMSYYPSFVERDVLKKINPALRVKAIPLYAYEHFREEIDLDFSRRKGMLFVGGFAHRPNADAVLWFAKEVYPRIRREVDHPFYICGSKVPEEIRALEGDGIVVKGFVTTEELMSLYETCRVAVVPLRFGAGVKGKVLEAMYQGIPLVTTPVGAEGIPGVETVIGVREGGEEFAGEVIRLCRFEEDCRRMAAAEQEYMKAHFSEDAAWETINGDFI